MFKKKKSGVRMESASSALLCGGGHEDARNVLTDRGGVRPSHHKPWNASLYTTPHTAEEWAMVWITAHKKITAWCRSALEQLPEEETLIRVQRLRAGYHNKLSTCADDVSISLDSLLFLRCLDDATHGSGVCWKFPFP